MSEFDIGTSAVANVVNPITGLNINPQNGMIPNILEGLRLVDSVLKQLGSPSIQELIKTKMNQQVMKSAPNVQQQPQEQIVPAQKPVNPEIIYNKIISSLEGIKQMKGDLTISQLLIEMQNNKSLLLELFNNEFKS